MTRGAELPAVVDRYIAAVNARDWAAIAPCFTDDAEFWTLGVRTAHGSARIAKQLRESMGALPETYDEVVRVAVDGTIVFVEMVFRGRTTAGNAFEVNAADVIELTPDGSAITRVAAWFDSAQRPT
ncbi:DUF4440 domain-containing protein [Streptomyces sp. SID8382]|uniref:nuclear transport factor 2 family protein n=1 Tax=Streptomyces malaysiensis TaxID=92644 RepID=UPI000C2CBA80|nr:MULTISPECIES: nuclear transport factor 2 family protein [unclassified Streptomyces]AUA16537.1 SnoaL-like domain protein [Streptomyces sp. M56]MYX54789.1 DUF4440 domain-containing protein [Streptomyces sp. SID8382]